LPSRMSTSSYSSAYSPQSQVNPVFPQSHSGASNIRGEGVDESQLDPLVAPAAKHRLVFLAEGFVYAD
jgi:hypothetical protein